MTDDETTGHPISPVKITAAQRRATKAAAAKPKDPRKAKPGTRNLGPTLVQEIAVARRRTEAVRLAMSGLNYVQIGRALTRQGGVTEGYDGDMDDVDLAAVVRSDVARAREAARLDLHQTVAEHRRLMVDRHYYMLSTVWDDATIGRDHEARRDALAIMGQINRLDGLYEATRVNVGPDDPLIREAYEKIVKMALDEAAGKLGDLDPANTDGSGDLEPVDVDPDL